MVCLYNWTETLNMRMNMPDFPETRSSLLLQVQDGPQNAAWLEFATLYRPVIYRLGRKRGLQDADAQDLAQTVLLSISRSIERWNKHEDGTSFRSWVRRITNNAIVNALTRKPRDAASGGPVPQMQLEQLSEPSPNLQQEVEREYRREVFQRAAAIVRTDVTEDSWAAFELTVIDGQGVESVAQQLKKSIGAVYTARSRVIRPLREVVEELEDVS